MKLDAAQLRAEADAHRARMESPLWTPSEGEGTGTPSWTAALSVSPAVVERALGPKPAAAEQAPLFPNSLSSLPAPPSPAQTEVSVVELLPQLESISRSIAKLATAADLRSSGGVDVTWLQSAAGNPHTYDAPDPGRRAVCVRILPTTYRQIQKAQRLLGLRTTAGTWEYVLRLGLTALGRLPAP